MVKVGKRRLDFARDRYVLVADVAVRVSVFDKRSLGSAGLLL